MTFLSPLLLLGVLAVAIPPIIHLIHRRQAKTVRFPALEFIRRSNRKTSRKFKARQLLLMLIRMAVLGLLAFALSRPFLRGADTPSAVTGDLVGAMVVVIDASYPMAYLIDGESLQSRARFQAEELLAQLQGQAALVIAGDEVVVPIGEPTTDFASILRAISKIEPGFGNRTLPEAVTRAYELLGDQPTGASRRVVVLTSAAGVVSPLPVPPAGDGTPIELLPIDVANGTRVPNHAITDVALRPAPELGAGQWRVDARVANYSDEPLIRLPVHLEVDGVVEVRGFLTLEPGAEGVKTFYVQVPGLKATPASVILKGDALSIDDRRDFWLQPAPKIRALAVNGDPHPTPFRDELFYLEHALAPAATAGTRIALTLTDIDNLDHQDLREFDVVILANVADLSDTHARTLERFVRGGGGLFISVGDQTDRSVMNTRLAALLPRMLRNVRQAGDAAASAEAQDRQSAHITGFERGHSLLTPFADPASTTLTSAQIHKYILLDPAADAAGEVVLSIDDGAPLLLTRSVDQGRVVLLTTSIDRDWSDLSIRPDFVPLMQQIMRYLTRVVDLDTAPVLVGQPAGIPVEDPRVRRVTVQGPDGAMHSVERPRRDDEP
ncbi:MAG TPA: VWA domain-containing protein, partial [Nannocystis exedens]|nr:VWA domain-containing protein [Nannocystis exedens]